MGKKAAAAAAPSPEAKEQDAKPEEPKGEKLNGDFIFQDGSTYRGQYLKLKDDVLLDGEGLLTTGPETYKGQFEKGLYKSGRYTSCGGCIYNGAFRDNLFHGVGEYLWPDGRAYRGTWKDGLMHGRGRFLNFSFAAGTTFTGFAVEGRFQSKPREQDQAKRAFLAVYGGECSVSAGEALKDLAAKTTAEGAPANCDVLVMVPPAVTEEDTPERKDYIEWIASERRACEETVDGPFPEAAAVPQAAIQTFVSFLEQGAETPMRVTVFEEKSALLPDGADAGATAKSRLRTQQLQCVGQGIEFASTAPEAEPGSIRRAVLVNVSSEYDVAKAKWKLVLLEEVPAPA